MTTLYIPVLQDAEYGQFLSLPGSDLPPTFAEWQREQAVWIKACQARGSAIQKIHVSFSDFKERLALLGIPTGGSAELDDYALTEGSNYI